MAVIPARSPLLTIEAIALIAIGVIALLAPIFAGLFAATALGVLLVLVGVVGLVSAYNSGAHLHRGWSFASAAIALVVGLLVIFNPLAGVFSLTLLLAAYLLLDGISLIGLAMDQRRRGVPRWGLLALAGVVDLLLAVLLVLLGAVSSAVVIGVILGVDLLAAGAALLLIHRLPLTGPIQRPV